MFSGSQGDDENVIHSFSKQFWPSLSTNFWKITWKSTKIRLEPPLLAHLTKSQVELLPSHCVRRPSVNFLHFDLLLENHWNFCLLKWYANQARQKSSFGWSCTANPYRSYCPWNVQLCCYWPLSRKLKLLLKDDQCKCQKGLAWHYLFVTTKKYTYVL